MLTNDNANSEEKKMLTNNNANSENLAIWLKVLKLGRWKCHLQYVSVLQ